MAIETGITRTFHAAGGAEAFEPLPFHGGRGPQSDAGGKIIATSCLSGMSLKRRQDPVSLYNSGFLMDFAAA